MTSFDFRLSIAENTKKKTLNFNPGPLQVFRPSRIVEYEIHGNLFPIGACLLAPSRERGAPSSPLFAAVRYIYNVVGASGGLCVSAVSAVSAVSGTGTECLIDGTRTSPSMTHVDSINSPIDPYVHLFGLQSRASNTGPARLPYIYVDA